jgi:hypothetical protein
MHRTSHRRHATGSGSLSEIPTPPWLHFVHPPTLQLNEKQDIVSNQPVQGKDFHSEEIRPDQNFHV